MTPEELAAIFQRIVNAHPTFSDLATLRDVLLCTGDQYVVQPGSGNINIQQGRDINIANYNFNVEEAGIIRRFLERLTGIPQNLPYSGVVKFVGRDEDFFKLHQKLQQSQKIAITAIAGMGGVGKTELALQYALHYCQEEFYPGGICWLEARDVDLATQIVNFARSQLNLNPPEDLDLPTQVNYCWRHWREGEVLVVLDDVTDYKQIKPYLPSNEPRFKILITTRQKKLAKFFPELYLEVLEPLAALELLAFLIEGERIVCQLDNKQDIPSELCNWLGYLPLGLELVGRYLADKEDLSLAQMLARLKKKRLEQRSLIESEDDMTAQLGIKAAFELSWQELTDEARQLACFLSLFALAPIPWSLVEQCLLEEDEEDLEDLRDGVLVKLSLVQRIGERTYQLHQLVRQYFRDKLEQMPQAEKLKRQFCRSMVVEAKKIPNSYSITREVIQEITPVISHLTEVAEFLSLYIPDQDLIVPFKGLGSLYENQRLYSKAESLYEKSLDIAKKRFGDNHLDVAQCLNNLAYIRKTKGNYHEAEELNKQALAIRKNLLGDKHRSVAQSLNNLATVYRKTNRCCEAEPLLKEALAIRRKCLKDKDPKVGMSLNHLGLLYYDKNNYSEAEIWYKKALEFYNSPPNQNHPFKATNLDDLAKLYCSQGKYAEAEPLYQQALKMRRNLLGEGHPSVATSLNNLAELYRSQGRYEEAEPFYLQALEIAEQVLGEAHPDTKVIRQNLQRSRQLSEESEEG